MNSTNIPILAIFVVFIVLTWMLSGMYKNEVIIIEENPMGQGQSEGFSSFRENMETLPKVPKVSKIEATNVTNIAAKVNGCQTNNQLLVNPVAEVLPPIFHERDANYRYSKDSCPCGCPNGCQCGSGCNRCGCKSIFEGPDGIDELINMNGKLPCNDGIDWSIHREAGSNGTTDDNIWHYMSPKMVLIDNNMQCGKWCKGANYNPPTGKLNNLASQYDSGMEPRMKQVGGVLYDEFPIPDYSNGCTGFNHILSGPRTNGQCPLEHDCVNQKIQENSGCI